jgi:hypothetical protein
MHLSKLQGRRGNQGQIPHVALGSLERSEKRSSYL